MYFITSGKTPEKWKMRDDTATHYPLIHDFDSDLLASALGHSLDDGTDLLGDPTLAANDLAHVALGYTGINI